MAKLTQPESNSFETGPLAPTGTFVAACLEIFDIHQGLKRKRGD